MDTTVSFDSGDHIPGYVGRGTSSAIDHTAMGSREALSSVPEDKFYAGGDGTDIWHTILGSQAGNLISAILGRCCMCT
jgi:hypothetical protein